MGVAYLLHQLCCGPCLCRLSKLTPRVFLSRAECKWHGCNETWKVSFWIPNGLDFINCKILSMGNCDMYILFTGNTYSSSYHKSLMCQSQSLGFWFKKLCFITNIQQNTLILFPDQHKEYQKNTVVLSKCLWLILLTPGFLSTKYIDATLCCYFNDFTDSLMEGLNLKWK